MSAKFDTFRYWVKPARYSSGKEGMLRQHLNPATGICVRSSSVTNWRCTTSPIASKDRPLIHVTPRITGGRGEAGMFRPCGRANSSYLNRTDIQWFKAICNGPLY